MYGMRPLYVGNRARHDGAELGVESAKTELLAALAA